MSGCESAEATQARSASISFRIFKILDIGTPFALDNEAFASYVSSLRLAQAWCASDGAQRGDAGNEPQRGLNDVQ
jgi:hypothetical protein